MPKPYAIAAGHRLTAEAAAAMLGEGGSAADAAVAAALMAMVAEPVLAGLCGGGFAMIRTPAGETRLLDAFVQTPAVKRGAGEIDFRAIEADFGETRQEFHIGAGAIAASGLPAGLHELHARLGRLPLALLTGPAVEAARAGVVVTDYQARLGRIIAPILMASPESRALYCSEGAPHPEGTLARNPDLADVLEVFGREGPRLIQEGEVAAALIRLAESGGHLTRADLAGYRPQWRRALIRSRGPVEIALNPPPALGGALIAFALEMTAPGAGPAGIARALEATTRARVETGLQQDPDGGTRRLLDADLLARYRAGIAGRPAAARGTTQISVIDGAGLGVALTLSNGEGCGLIAPGTGIMANNMLGEDDLVPGDWLSWQPGRRMASMMAPMAVTWPDGRAAMLGSGGSNRIRSALTQILINLIDRRMALEPSITAPRLHVEAGDPPAVDFEAADMAEADRAALVAAYPEARGWPERSMFFGGAHGVLAGAEGPAEAAGDPRRAGYALTG